MPRFLVQTLRAPVYLFQMGKVGSSSLEATLAAHLEGMVVQAHTHDSMPLRARRLLRWRRQLHLPVYVICPVREPLARNVSAFFQNFRRDTGFEISDHPWTVAELTDLFLRCYPHNVCLEWFDRHFRPTFGIDVFASPFSVEKKWAVYRRGSVRVLIFRSDLEHAEQLRLVSGFLGVEIPRWNYANQAETKDYGELYRDFVAAARLPDIYLSIMARSRFCQQFWSEDEIATTSRRWRG